MKNLNSCENCLDTGVHFRVSRLSNDEMVLDAAVMVSLIGFGLPHFSPAEPSQKNNLPQSYKSSYTHMIM